MHIAKAGGSTVNAYLQAGFPAGQSRVHIESSAEWRDDPPALLRFDFLSGHLGLKSLDDRIDLSSYRLVTVVRDPLPQLVSHLAWIRRLAEPGEEARLHQHPEHVQAFAAKLAACDFRDATAVKRLVEGFGPTERGLVDNCHIRYFAPPPPAWIGEDQVAQALAAVPRFHRIGLVELMDDFLSGLARDLGWPRPQRVPRENVTRDFFGLEAMSEGVREALLPLYRHDQVLYEHLRARVPRWRIAANRLKSLVRKG